MWFTNTMEFTCAYGFATAKFDLYSSLTANTWHANCQTIQNSWIFRMNFRCEINPSERYFSSWRKSLPVMLVFYSFDVCLESHLCLSYAKHIGSSNQNQNQNFPFIHLKVIFEIHFFVSLEKMAIWKERTHFSIVSVFFLSPRKQEKTAVYTNDRETERSVHHVWFLCYEYSSMCSNTFSSFSLPTLLNIHASAHHVHLTVQQHIFFVSPLATVWYTFASPHIFNVYI